MLLENILINLRTYDTHSLILYANDHLNNFAHLYVSNGTQIVYLFNAGNEIKNITVKNPSTLKSFEANVCDMHIRNFRKIIRFFRCQHGNLRTDRHNSGRELDYIVRE